MLHSNNVIAGKGPARQSSAVELDPTPYPLDWLASRGMWVPDDVSVIGFDGIPEGKTSTPPLTTIAQPIADRVEFKPFVDRAGLDPRGRADHTGVLQALHVGGGGGSGGLLDLGIADQVTRINRADALSHGPDGWVYLADSAIPHQMLQPKAHIAANAPYYIYRFKPGIPGVAGM